MKENRNRVSLVVACALIALGARASNVVAQDVIPSAYPPPQEINFQGATLKEKALLRRQIQIMHPEVLPLRVIFVPHWKYVDNTRVFRLHLPKGYTSLMFTHLPSRTVFIDADRYINEESLGYWVAHELGHLVTNSAKEADAERSAVEYRKRLKAA